MQGLGLSGEPSELWIAIDGYVELGRQCWRFHPKEMKSDLRRSLLTKPYCSRPREEAVHVPPGPWGPLALVEC